MKRFLSFTLALVLLGSLCLLSGCGGAKFTNFCDTDLRGYVDFSLKDFTGKTISLSGVYPTVTRQTAIHEFDFTRLLNADSTLGEGDDVYLSKPGWGDHVYIYYDLTAQEGGETKGSNLYSQSGAQQASVGYWEFEDMLDRYDEESAKKLLHPIFTDKVLSDALLDTMPLERLYPKKIEKSYPELGDVLLLDYAISQEDKNTLSYEGVYINTSNREACIREFGEDFYAALIDGTHKIGESYEVVTTLKNDKGKDVATTYKVTVSSAVEKTFAKEGDVLFISYALMYDDRSQSGETAYDVRIDTTAADLYIDRYGADFYNSLLDGTHCIGESYELKTTLKNEKGEDVAVTYLITPHYTVLESYKTVAIDLAADAFDESYSDSLRALNGTRVYLSFYVHHYEDFVVPAFDSTFLKEIYGFTSEETDPERIKEEAIDAMVSKLQREQEEKIKAEAWETFWASFYTEALAKKIPNAPYNEQYGYIVSVIEDAYRKDYNDAVATGKDFPYADVNEYAASYVNPPYSLEEFPTLADYADTLARETVAERVVVFAMAQMASVRMSSIALRQTYEEVLADYAESFEEANGYEGTTEEIIMVGTGGKMTSEEEFEWYILWTITQGDLIEYVYENNTWQYKTE